MTESHQTKLILIGSSLVKVLLVAGLILSLGWGLVQLAKWKTSDPTGTVVLLADDAEIVGEGQARANLFAGKRNIGWWDNPTQSLAWEFNATEAGSYLVELEYALPNGHETEFVIETSGKSLSATIQSSGGWSTWKTVDVGTIDLMEGQSQKLALKPIRSSRKGVMNFVSLKLIPKD